MLKKVGLGKVVEKLKDKHIDNLKKKLSKATNPQAIAKYASKLKKAENNLVVFKEQPDSRNPESAQVYQAKVVAPPTSDIIETPALVAESGNVKTAGMSKVAMVILGLAAVGMAVGAGKKKNESKTKTKK